MPAIQRILCATDFSPASASAWPFAQRLARAAAAELVLLHVIPGGAGTAPGGTRQAQDLRQETTTALDRLVEFRLDERAPVSVRVEAGRPAEGILAAIDREAASLVVLGTHRRSGLDRLLLGSVAEEVVERATCPVITVPALPWVTEAAARPIHQLLYVTDLSPAAARAWAWVQMMAATAGAAVQVVSADSGQPLAAARDAVERFLTAAGPPVAGARLRLLDDGDAERTVERADAEGIDLVVVGLAARAGDAEASWASRRILRAAACPVLTVGPDVAGPTDPESGRPAAA